MEVPRAHRRRELLVFLFCDPFGAQSIKYIPLRGRESLFPAFYDPFIQCFRGYDIVKASWSRPERCPFDQESAP